MSRGLSKEALEFRASRGQLHQGSPEPVAGGAQFVGPWFNSLTAAHYTDRPNRKAFRQWAIRHGVRSARGLYAKADIDRVLGVLGRRRSA